MIKTMILTKSIPRPTKIRGNRKERWCFQFRNKSFYFFLTGYLGIIAGSKSSFVRMPLKIKNANIRLKKYFLAGLFDTDGGFRGNSLGFTTASKDLNKDVHDLLDELLIRHSLDKWENKKYGKFYYGIRIAKSEIDNFLNKVPIQNKEKLKRIRSRFP